MSRDEGFLRSLVRSPRHTEVGRTHRPHPTDTGLAGKRPARPLRSFAPLGSPFRNDPTAGQPGAVRRCSPGVLRPPELAPPRFGVRSLALTHAGGKAPCHVHHRAPSHRGCIPRSGLRRLSSRAQDPSRRGVYRTPRLTVRRRPSSPSVSRTLGAPATSPVPRPAGRFGTERLARAPSRRHPAPPCPSRPSPP